LDEKSTRTQNGLMNDPTSPNARLIRRYFAELWNQGRVELVPELLHVSYVNHSPGSPDMPADRSGVAGIVGTMREAFPDLHYRVDDLLEAADAVVVRLTVTGTHRGDFFGAKPSGKAFRVAQINIEHVSDGKIVAHHRLTDELSLLRQIGVLSA
jgi:steroid delta-isomerase-like uncharacterized protein